MFHFKKWLQNTGLSLLCAQTPGLETWFLSSSGCLDSPINHTQNRFVNLPFSSRRCLIWGNSVAISAFLSLQVLHAHLAAADASPQLSRFQSLRGRSADKLLLLLHRGQPEAVLVGKVMARSPSSIALDERSSSEILQAGARRDKGLASSFCPRRSVLK